MRPSFPAAGSRLVLSLGLGLGLALAGCGGSGGGRAGQSVASATSGSATATSSSTSGATTPGSTVAAAPLAPPAGSWLKGDFHVHSEHSDDSQPLGDGIASQVAMAQHVGLDFLSISDHRQTTCLTDPQFLGNTSPVVLIAGEEWGQPGHAGAHGLTRDPIAHAQDETQGAANAVARLQDTIDDIHKMGGIFVLNHPIDNKTPWFWPTTGHDAVEVWNAWWALRAADEVTDADCNRWCDAHGFPAAGLSATPEARAALATRGRGQGGQRLAFYEAHLNAGRHVGMVGGGDAHYIFMPGYPTTEVFAKSRTKDDILAAVKAGRTQIRRGPDAPTLDFTADRDGDGVFESITGDSLPLGKPITLRIHVTDAVQGKVELVKNGAVVQTWTPTGMDFVATFQDTPTAKAWYRVNVSERIDMSFPGAGTLKALAKGSTAAPWLGALLTSSLGSSGFLGKIASKAQLVMDSGGPALLWILLKGSGAGVHPSNIATQNVRLDVPRNVSQVLNVRLDDEDYCMGALSGAIWAE